MRGGEASGVSSARICCSVSSIMTASLAASYTPRTLRTIGSAKGRLSKQMNRRRFFLNALVGRVAAGPSRSWPLTSGDFVQSVGPDRVYERLAGRGAHSPRLNHIDAVL